LPESSSLFVSSVLQQSLSADSSLSALKIADGQMIWHKQAPAGVCSWGAKGCGGVESAAVSVIPGIVFSGAVDGHLRGYSTEDGSIV
jgi:polyvinyl alcohol dehydrogenase (cytochrome)